MTVDVSGDLSMRYYDKCMYFQYVIMCEEKESRKGHAFENSTKVYEV